MIKEKITITIFLTIIIGFCFLFFIKEDNLLSESERRYLKQSSDITKETLLNGELSKTLESYMLDQFPYREGFRKIKSFSNYQIFRKLENKDIIIKNNNLIKLNFNYNYDEVEKTFIKLNKLSEKYDKNNKYCVIVPDKSCYINHIDYEKIKNIATFNLKNVEIIDIYNDLNLENYYKSDSHWTQNKIEHIASNILTKMNIELKEIEYKENTIPNFYGIYSANSASFIKDDLIYLTNDTILNSKVFNYETNKTTNIYDLDKLNDEKSLDNYDIFLSGATPLLRIDTPIKNNQTLVVFRDSYGSSIIPLFTDYYETIYVIDIRYIDSRMISKLIKINEEADILFLYSTTILEISGNFRI